MGVCLSTYCDVSFYQVTWSEGPNSSSDELGKKVEPLKVSFVFDDLSSEYYCCIVASFGLLGGLDLANLTSLSCVVLGLGKRRSLFRTCILSFHHSLIA